MLAIDVCLDTCLVDGDWIFPCLDVELLLDAAVVVVDEDDGNVFWETIVEYCRTGWVDDDVVVVAVGYVKCGGTLVESPDDRGVFVVDETLGDCWFKFGFFGEDAWEVLVVDEPLAPEFDLEKKRLLLIILSRSF